MVPSLIEPCIWYIKRGRDQARDGRWRYRRFGGKNDAPFLIAVAALAVVLACQGAAAKGACDRRERVLDLLAQKFQETPVAVGVTSQGGLVEVLSHGAGKTWTIIVTSPQGMSCLLLTGEGWKKLQQIAQEPEA